MIPAPRDEVLLPPEAGRGPRLAIPLVWGLAASGVVIALAQRAGNMSMKQLLVVIMALALGPAVLLSRRAKELLLILLMVSLTYNRNYFSFEWLVGNHALNGLYWIVGDVFIAGLYAIWAYERVVLKRSFAPQGPPVWVWMLPFTLVAMASAFAAEHIAWGLFEVWKIAKGLLILVYLRYNLGRREWWLCIAGLGIAVGLQGALGMLEMASGHTGILWLFGKADDMSALPEDFRKTEDAYAGFMRATATMGHPPVLANYMLLVPPLFLALALTAPRPAWRRLAGAVGIIGLVGQACTLSRWPAVLTLGQMGLLALALILSRTVRPTRILGLAVMAGFAVSLVLLPFADLIAERVTRDLDASVDLRLRDYRVAFAMFLDHPLLGVGINNYGAHMLDYGAEGAVFLSDKFQEAAMHILHLRYMNGPLNVYLFVAAVTGLLGVLTFLLLPAGMIVTALRTAARTQGQYRAMSLAFVVGLLGVLGEQLVDYSLLTDPILFTVICLFGLVAAAGTLFAAPQGRHATAVAPSAATIPIMEHAGSSSAPHEP